MKIIRMLVLSSTLCIAGALEAQEGLILRFERAGDDIRLIFDSQTGTNYQFQVSTSLTSWDDWGTEIIGDGLSKTQVVSTTSQRMALFRLRASPTSTGTAPSDAEFAALVIGKKLFSYNFVNSDRFSWSSETGNWGYTKTGGSVGELVFTYDEDGNNPAIYREEILLTFETPISGTYRYSEFNSNIENPRSVLTGPFQLGQ